MTEQLAKCGSSPHLRGTHEYDSRKIKAFRFIPAPAGNTSKRLSFFINYAVHPRTCGEHEFNNRYLVMPERFIPAPAGNTPEQCIFCGLIAVHPRTCGEHSGVVVYAAAWIGSSPHLRGTQSANQYHASSTRFIPAPAGNTKSSKTRRYLMTVHPRTCGEH